MSELTLDRRQMVRAAAGVAAGGALVAGAGVGSAAADDDNGKRLFGSWWVTHTDDPPAPPNVGVSVVSVLAGGVIISNDINPAAPTSTGVWRMRRNNRFRAAFWVGFPAGGPPDAPAYARIEVSGRLEDGEISGTFTFTGFDANDVELFSGTGTFEGTRIKL